MAEDETEQPRKKLKLDTLALPHPIAVLGDEYFTDGPVELVQVYLGQVTNKRCIASSIQSLKTVLPMPDNLTHLKRVRGDKVILTFVENFSKEDLMDFILDKVPGLRPVPRVYHVPRHPPKTKRQFEEANVLWPCNFHPCIRIEKLLSRTFFTDDEVFSQHEYMRLALKTAEEKVSLAGAVVVDGKSKEVVAVGFDERTRNPSHHAAMSAIENVAAGQRILFEKYGGCEGARKGEKNDTESEASELPYLCTGYDVYLTREPCIMCSMAMVHSRVRHVFYGYSSKDGALDTKCKVHTSSALNHRYLVFKHILFEEC